MNKGGAKILISGQSAKEWSPGLPPKNVIVWQVFFKHLWVFIRITIVATSPWKDADEIYIWWVNE